MVALCPVLFAKYLFFEDQQRAETLSRGLTPSPASLILTAVFLKRKFVKYL
jgi:hypothetical protein